MKTGITAKLFVAILATNLLTAIAVGVAVRGSFSSGFRTYVEEREARRVDNLDRALVRAYTQHGSWQFLATEPSLWSALNRPEGGAEVTDGASFRPPGQDNASSQDARDGGAPPLPQDLQIMPPRESNAARDRHREPPPDGGRERDRQEGFDAPPGGDRRRGPGGPPPGMLLDAARNVVAGRLDANGTASERPVIVAGKTVGYLKTSNGGPPFDTFDMRFRDQQLRAVWLIGIVAMLIATCVALLLARRFLAPIKRLATATHRLASGDYASRVSPASADELGALLDDFNQLAQTLERNEQLRRNFMADVSHELRTPLAVLRGELEALQDGIRAPTSESIASLQSEVATLSKLVGDLYELALADVGALAYRFVRTDISSVLDTAVAAFGHRFSERDLTLEYAAAQVPVVIDADPQRLMQLFNNLLENCARHTDPGGRVSIALARDDHDVRIDIQDSAPGVPADAMGHIFERLFRVEGSRSREHGGAGLGLAIAHNIVEAHRGDVNARPSPLGGLWIRIRLPIAGES